MSRFSFFRSFHQRQLVKQQERLVFENYLKANGLQNFADLEFLLKRLLYYYEVTDGDKLVRTRVVSVDRNDD